MADAVAELGPLTSKQGYSFTSTDRHGRRDEFLEGTLGLSAMSDFSSLA